MVNTNVGRLTFCSTLFKSNKASESKDFLQNHSRGGLRETAHQKPAGRTGGRLKMATFNPPETAVIAACYLPGIHLDGEYCDSTYKVSRSSI